MPRNSATTTMSAADGLSSWQYDAETSASAFSLLPNSPSPLLQQQKKKYIQTISGLNEIRP